MSCDRVPIVTPALPELGHIQNYYPHTLVTAVVYLAGTQVARCHWASLVRNVDGRQQYNNKVLAAGINKRRFVVLKTHTNRKFGDRTSAVWLLDIGTVCRHISSKYGQCVQVSSKMDLSTTQAKRTNCKTDRTTATCQRHNAWTATLYYVTWGWKPGISFVTSFSS